MMPQLTPVIKNLLIINAIFFIACLMIKIPNIDPVYIFNERTGGYDLTETYEGLKQFLSLHHIEHKNFRPWQIFTFFFTHADSSHLLFNMLGLVFLGPNVEMRLGSKRFLQMYVYSSLGAVLLHIIMGQLQFGGSLLGASGSVFGVLASFGILFPNTRVQLLFPPIPLTGRQLAIGYFLLEVFLGLRGSTDGVAHYAHIGGAITAFLLLMFWKKNSKL